MTIGGISGYSTYGIYTGYGLQSGETEAEEELKKLQNPEAAEREEESKETDPDKKVKPGYESSSEECETCKNRKYQDGSDEVNVSFKNASHVSPNAAASAVRAHEQQHVSNAYKKAATDESAKVVSATVSIHTSVCPECGKTYVSGGETRTRTMYTKMGAKANLGDTAGANVDYTA